MTQKQLEHKVKYWQKILKLDHWDITCEFGHPTDMEGSYGRNSIQSPYFTSHIKIQDPKNYQIPEIRHEEEFERSIIHELVHCHTSILRPHRKRGEIPDEERLVTTLEKVIYDLWAGE